MLTELKVNAGSQTLRHSSGLVTVTGHRVTRTQRIVCGPIPPAAATAESRTRTLLPGTLDNRAPRDSAGTARNGAALSGAAAALAGTAG